MIQSGDTKVGSAARCLQALTPVLPAHLYTGFFPVTCLRQVLVQIGNKTLDHKGSYLFFHILVYKIAHSNICSLLFSPTRVIVSLLEGHTQQNNVTFIFSNVILFIERSKKKRVLSTRCDFFQLKQKEINPKAAVAIFSNNKVHG